MAREANGLQRGKDHHQARLNAAVAAAPVAASVLDVAAGALVVVVAVPALMAELVGGVGALLGASLEVARGVAREGVQGVPWLRDPRAGCKGRLDPAAAGAQSDGMSRRNSNEAIPILGSSVSAHQRTTEVSRLQMYNFVCRR